VTGAVTGTVAESGTVAVGRHGGGRQRDSRSRLSPTPAPTPILVCDVWIGPRNEPVLETLRPKPGCLPPMLELLWPTNDCHAQRRQFHRVMLTRTRRNTWPS
jgi:hypothetical protein